MRHTIAAVAGASAACLLLAAGCGETKNVTLYMQDLDVTSPAPGPPLHITRNPAQGEVHITPHLRVSPRRNLRGNVGEHTRVNGRGVFQVDTVYTQGNGVYFADPGGVNSFGYAGRNLRWEVPASFAGVDVDLGLSRAVALSLGAGYAPGAGKGLWGYHAGLGFRRQSGSTALRLDVGLQWQELSYRTRTVVAEQPLGGGVSRVFFYDDPGSSSSARFYGALTVNTVHDDWAVNPFLQVGVASQSVSEFKPVRPAAQAFFLPPFFLIPQEQLFIVQDLRGEFSATLVHLTPGFYIALDEDLMVVAGVRVSFETTIENASSSVLAAPVLLLDWGL
ncbi:MAG: hypothetical protein WB626_07960 [Bacteroidota bacterium]